jgi:hypothetical protein
LRAYIDGAMTRTFAKTLAASAIGWMLAASFHGESAFAAAQIVVRPPPHVIVRSPPVQTQQQLSFWGVKSNLQKSQDSWQYHDELPATPQHRHRRSRLPR